MLMRQKHSPDRLLALNANGVLDRVGSFKHVPRILYHRSAEPAPRLQGVGGIQRRACARLPRVQSRLQEGSDPRARPASAHGGQGHQDHPGNQIILVESGNLKQWRAVTGGSMIAQSISLPVSGWRAHSLDFSLSQWL